MRRITQVGLLFLMLAFANWGVAQSGRDRPPRGLPDLHGRWYMNGDPEQETRIGNQTGGRVFLFLYTDDFWRDYDLFRSLGIEFVRDPKDEPYGTVAVFKDLYGNLWDLIQSR